MSAYTVLLSNMYEVLATHQRVSIVEFVMKLMKKSHQEQRAWQLPRSEGGGGGEGERHSCL